MSPQGGSHPAISPSDKRLRRGKDHPSWNGGKTNGPRGYVRVKAEGHPRAHLGYVYEHILVVERAMGKHLRVTAPVHHINEIRSDNRSENLVACDSNAYHKLLHVRAAAFAACGDPNKRRCRYCNTYDSTDKMTKFCRADYYWHARCATLARKARAK